MGFGGGVSGSSGAPQTKILVLIESYKATIAEATKTFNLAAALQNFDNISEILVKIDGQNAVLTMILQARVNGDAAANYLSMGSRRLGVTGAETAIANGVAVTQWTLADSTTIAAAFSNFNGWLSIQLSNVQGGGGDDDKPLATSMINGIDGGVAWNTQHMNHYNQLAKTSITSVTILASVNWAIGTRITCYAVKRTDSV